MATYKLIQDIEAEDHILGPLSLRQFIFALVAAFLFYICFILVVKHAVFLLAVFLPPALFCAFFAFPFGGDQPTELWALAKLRFWFKPRRRIWSQSGVKELVTITVPKKIEHIYSDGLSQSEVKSRLQALANTIDSRGWAIKHINAVGYIPPQAVVTDSDRLIDIDNAPQEVPDSGVEDDMLDADHSPIAQQFDSMINRAGQDRRQRLIDELKGTAPAEAPAEQSSQQWFMSHNPASAAAPAAPLTAVEPPVQPAVQAPAAAAVTTADEAALSSQLKSQAASQEAYGNLRTLQPLSSQAPPITTPAPPVQTAMTASSDPAILSLSNNDDLNVATIAREAHKASQNGNGAQDEVVISLH
jgi:hypothetical protein